MAIPPPARRGDWYNSHIRLVYIDAQVFVLYSDGAAQRWKMAE
jgi:hypothetical protein